MSENVMIAPAKLEIPACPPGFIERPVLMENLTRLLQQKLTCLVAPLGSGKTCAMAEFARLVQDGRIPQEINDASYRVAWMSVDERDADSRRFWSHVFASLFQPEKSNDVLETALEIIGSTITLEAVEQAASLLFELQDNRHIILMLDGIDKIKDTAIDEELLHFISYSPREFHVMVSARRLSEKMECGSYTHGQIQINYHDLLLSNLETRHVLETGIDACGDVGEDNQDKSLDSILCNDQLEEIYGLCEGWPQGVALAEQSMVACMQHGHPFKFGGASNSVKRYFTSNTRASVPADLAFAFKSLAMLERFNKPLFKSMFSAFPEVRERFDDVTKSGAVLVITCDEEGEWYRYNHLFADWVRRGLHTNEKHAIRKMCLAASEWFNAKGYSAEAAKCLLMAVDFDYVSDIVEATSGQRSNVKDEDAFIWVSQIPASRFPKSPLLSLLTAWSYNVIGRIRDAEEWLEAFRTAALGSPKLSDEDAHLAIKYLEAKHLAMTGDNQYALKLNEELLMATQSQERSLTSMLYQSIGEANEHLGRLKIAEEMFLQAQASASVDNTEHHLYFNMFSYAKIRFNLGDFDECEAACRKLLDICPDEFVFRDASHAVLALIYVERNMLEEAAAEVARSLEDATPYQNVDMYLQSKIAESTLVSAMGDLAEAYEIISEAVMHGERTIVPMNVLLTAYFKQSEVAMKRGNLRELQIIERKFRMQADEQDMYHSVMYQMVLGACLSQQGRTEEAIAAYADAAEIAREVGASFLEAKALVELLICGRDEGASSGAVLGRLLQIVDSHGFLRVLIDAGAPMRDMLRKYSSSSHVNAQTRQFVKSILVVFERELHSSRSIEDVQNARIGKLDNLTIREREVLGLLNMGMSRKEIAETLCVSINTAKKHLSNIYSKLGAQSRDQALDAIAESTSAAMPGSTLKHAENVSRVL